MKPCWNKCWKWRTIKIPQVKDSSTIVCEHFYTHKPLCVIPARLERAKEWGVKKENAQPTSGSLLALPAPLAWKYCETWNGLCRFQTATKLFLSEGQQNICLEGNDSSSKSKPVLLQTTASSLSAHQVPSWT